MLETHRRLIRKKGGGLNKTEGQGSTNQFKAM